LPDDVTAVASGALRRSLLRAAPELRRDLPWIACGDPWAILVSEVMLQQTQTSRVVDPWHRFMERFPTPLSCAEAPMALMLRSWEGLGFHRRARNLHNAARMLVDEFGGEVPRDVASLRRLPGVGEYTAHAVASFAFGAPVAVLDTNVGRVLARAVANRTLAVAEARSLAAQTLAPRSSARFNQAMLDLGAQFCTATPRCATCPVRRVCRWHREGGNDPAPSSAAVSKPQSTFAGSDRQMRGRMLARLRVGPVTEAELLALTGGFDEKRGRRVLASLATDGLVERHGLRLQLPGETPR